MQEPIKGFVQLLTDGFKNELKKLRSENIEP